MSILKFSHDRNADFNVESRKIFKAVEDFGENISIKPLLNHFKKTYYLPEKIVKKRIKKLIILQYRYKSAQFDKSLRLNQMFFSMFRTILSFIKLCFYGSNNKESFHYKLIVDDIRNDLQLKRFANLINLFDKKDVLIVGLKGININQFPNYNIKIIDHYDYKIITQVVIHELFIGIWVCLKTSISLGINLFPIYLSLVKEYYSYKTLFNTYRADYLIQERHYSTNPIKNFLFKESGGRATSSIQKNLIENDQMAYYIDIDYLFSLGNRTMDRVFKYGAEIDNIIPVGSFFMEYYWFNNPLTIKKNIDVIMLGMNIMNSYERFDKYDKFMLDYYYSIKWLVKFKRENPSYRVVIKHHSSAGEDEFENKILLDSDVEVLSKDDASGNSYQLAFNSRCVVTYGSTMCYEMIAHGVPSFFFDPEYRCCFLPDKNNDNLLGGLRLSTYKVFSDTLLSTLRKDNKVKDPSFSRNDLCLNSSGVSNKIYNIIMENNNHD